MITMMMIIIIIIIIHHNRHHKHKLSRLLYVGIFRDNSFDLQKYNRCFQMFYNLVSDSFERRRRWSKWWSFKFSLLPFSHSQLCPNQTQKTSSSTSTPPTNQPQGRWGLAEIVIQMISYTPIDILIYSLYPYIFLISRWYLIFLHQVGLSIHPAQLEGDVEGDF